MIPVEQNGKLFYRIGEISRLAGIKPHVIRYWETEFNQIKPEKSARGQRLYRRGDLEIILKIRELLYEKKYTIDGAKRELKTFSQHAIEPEAAPKKDSGIERAISGLKHIREMLK
jgi:DNA-binding transcriptional MerR regulator